MLTSILYSRISPGDGIFGSYEGSFLLVVGDGDEVVPFISGVSLIIGPASENFGIDGRFCEGVSCCSLQAHKNKYNTS